MNLIKQADLLRAGYWAGKWYQMTDQQQQEWRAALNRSDILTLLQIDDELKAKGKRRRQIKEHHDD